MNYDERIERLERTYREGRLIRHLWQREQEGRSLICLLLAIAPEVEAEHDYIPRACPADVMPGWLAELTPWIDDAGTAAAWPRTIERYIALAKRWRALQPDDWARVRDFAAANVLETAALQPSAPEAVATACRQAVRVLRAENPSRMARRRAVDQFDRDVLREIADAVLPDWHAHFERLVARLQIRLSESDIVRSELADTFTARIFDAIEEGINRVDPPHPAGEARPAAT